MAYAVERPVMKMVPSDAKPNDRSLFRVQIFGHSVSRSLGAPALGALWLLSITIRPVERAVIRQRAGSLHDIWVRRICDR